MIAQQESGIKWEYVLCLMVFFLMMALAVFMEGTADEGDSITHFLLTRSSWTHPHLFLDHWGKPVFTLLVSPFANLSFTAVKIFNIIVFSLAVFITVKIALKQQLGYSFIIPVLAVTTPHFIRYTLSGLTEPMFNLALVTGIYLLVVNRIFLSILLFSFLPFIRSEGLVILVVIAAYLVINRKYAYLPLLLTGHIFYSMIGHWVADKPFDWVFTEMTYAELKSNYGQGTWLHFFKRSPAVFGIPGVILIIAGTLKCLFSLRELKNHVDNRQNLNFVILVYGTAFSLFFFHVIAWAMGWFHSFGLTRVLNGVMSPFLLISTIGFNAFVNFVKSTYKRWVAGLLTITIIIFPLINYKYGFKKRQFELKAMQRVMKNAADVIREFYPDYRDRIICYEAPYLAKELNLDFYDPNMRSIMYVDTWKWLPAGTLLVWDEWYAVTQGRVSIDSIQAFGYYKKIAEFRDYDSWDQWDKPHYAILFEKIN
jgi:hypothetical protein